MHGSGLMNYGVRKFTTWQEYKITSEFLQEKKEHRAECQDEIKLEVSANDPKLKKHENEENKLFINFFFIPSPSQLVLR